MNNCIFCGQPYASIISPNDEQYYFVCAQCYQAFNTCRGCVNGGMCDFETNPSPLPKQIQQTVQQGNMIVQTVIKNPERVKLTCFNCGCFDQDDLFCRKEEGYCRAYQEYMPSHREDESIFQIP